jgi:heme O synthase-like polyprenyltransferase
MHYLIPLIWIAGAIQLLDVVANLAVPGKLRSRENLMRVSPILRQVFWSHWFYIMFVLVMFSMMCFFFAPDLAGNSTIGRFLSIALAVFWVLRVPIQVYWFDAEFRRRNRAADVCFVVSSMYLAVVFVFASMGVGR